MYTLHTYPYLRLSVNVLINYAYLLGNLKEALQNVCLQSCLHDHTSPLWWWSNDFQPKLLTTSNNILPLLLYHLLLI